ncbi:MAG TPA: hypothetical protein VLG49_07660 [Rhabdochlamydiaceae bacterium]|nr:hypothetical protein [Rhabdochlamydiaceae bacterium]
MAWLAFEVFLNGLGKSFSPVAMVMLIAYWVDPSLPKIKKLSFKRALLWIAIIFVILFNSDMFFNTSFMFTGNKGAY